MGGAGYDLSSSSFSPNGRIYQIEYATKAVQKSTTIIGIRGIDSVVLAFKKEAVDPLYTEEAGNRIFSIDNNIGIAVSGLIADGNLIVEMARQEARHFRNEFNAMISLEALCDRIAAFVHVHTMHSSVRPFGLSILLAGWDEILGPQLFKIDPSGSLLGYYGWACGKSSKQAKQYLEEYPIGTMSTEELVIAAGEVIYQNQDDINQKEFSLVISLVGKETAGEHKINPEPWTALAVNSGLSAVNDQDNACGPSTTNKKGKMKFKLEL